MEQDGQLPEIPKSPPQGGYQPEHGSLDNTNPPKNGSALSDPWEHRSNGMKCKTCMWFVNFRCRRHAPTMQGYPAVFENDWCGDHKLDKISMGGV